MQQIRGTPVFLYHHHTSLTSSLCLASNLEFLNISLSQLDHGRPKGRGKDSSSSAPPGWTPSWALRALSSSQQCHLHQVREAEGVLFLQGHPKAMKSAPGHTHSPAHHTPCPTGPRPHDFSLTQLAQLMPLLTRPRPWAGSPGVESS